MKWVLAEGDLFDLKYSFKEERKTDSGAGEAKSSSETNDKREVEAELAFKSEGVLAVKFKKITWVYGTQEYDITLTFVDGKAAQTSLKMKVDPKATTYAGAKAQAEALHESFKHLAEGDYIVDTQQARGETLFLRVGGAAVGRLALFDRIFTHGILPQGSVKKDQVWKDPLETTILPPGTLEAPPVLEHKVTAVTPKEVTAKASVSIPISKPPSGAASMSVTGNFAYSHEWTFARAGYLALSKEEATYSRKTDAKGKDADFYKSSGTHKVTQTLKITKRDAPK
jgi:hypothetical protein